MSQLAVNCSPKPACEQKATRESAHLSQQLFMPERLETMLGGLPRQG